MTRAQLSEDELVLISMGLLAAGVETTANEIANTRPRGMSRWADT